MLLSGLLFSVLYYGVTGFSLKSRDGKCGTSVVLFMIAALLLAGEGALHPCVRRETVFFLFLLRTMVDYGVRRSYDTEEREEK